MLKPYITPDANAGLDANEIGKVIVLDDVDIASPHPHCKQWGREYYAGYGTSVQGTITIAYPISFTGYNYIPVLVPKPDGTNATVSACYLHNVSPSGTECVYKASNVAIGGTYIYWFAIGS